MTTSRLSSSLATAHSRRKNDDAAEAKGRSLMIVTQPNSNFEELQHNDIETVDKGCMLCR